MEVRKDKVFRSKSDDSLNGRGAKSNGTDFEGTECSDCVVVVVAVYWLWTSLALVIFCRNITAGLGCNGNGVVFIVGDVGAKLCIEFFNRR